ncbi:MAG TPA: right-handed parallel beta-helix repeat-containing protein [Planctomycetaceae bacterium]|nr:right-handed parallel beta-helix repeat-containing protein [Planctomycetaceae bacterium]
MTRILIYSFTHLTHPLVTVVLVLLSLTSGPSAMGQSVARALGKDKPVGVQGPVGHRENPTRLKRLLITKPGLYENYLVDSQWEGGNRVKVTADNVTIRNCEIRNATGNGIGVFAKNTVIENCRIHHLLRSTYRDQSDAHGITGRWYNVTIRNCEIYYVSGDCVQFDPDRQSHGNVLIEDCTFWTGPLPHDAAGFKRGERPGENAFDSKTPATGPRNKIVIRNCLMYGWKQPAQINLMAALNLKENIHATVENCLFRENQVCLRLRGPGSRGGALVEVKSCAIYDSAVGVRMEDGLRDLKIDQLGFGTGVTREFHRVGRSPFPGFENKRPFRAPAFDQLQKHGFRSAKRPRD